MEVLHARCAGLDVHKKTVRVCSLIRQENGKNTKEFRTYSTTTQDLLNLLDWLLAQGCSHVAIEGTGVYWKPVYNLLEGAIELLVVNAAHIKAIKGRKTDVRDAEWIADLLQHGLLRASFIPTTEQRELRELTRYRTCLVQERTRAVNRLQKTLEDTNLKLGDVVSDIMGKSARAILEALLAGQTDPAILADLARGRLKAKRAQLEEALVGTVKPHHRFLLTEHLSLIDTLEEAITRVSTEIETQMATPSGEDEPKQEPEPCEPERDGNQIHAQVQNCPPNWQEAITLLDDVPGINPVVAERILAEIGTDMSRFPTAAHLASWTGLCPGNHESAGKRLSGKTRKGSRWLRQALIEAAHAAARTKNTYFSAQYKRIAARRGAKVAVVAVAHSLLVVIYHLLFEHKPYEELGADYFDQRNRQATEKRLVRRLEQLGYQVSLSVT